MSKTESQVALNIRFKVKPGKKDMFRDALFSVVNVMSNEPAFVYAIISDDTDNPDDLVIYEIWRGTKESWLQEEFSKPYRKEYEDVLGDLLEERIVSFLAPISEWGSTVTNTAK